ncbi:MAG: SUMF1/EgtB/PvdO family nonheme iron enzyme [Verrucomicrobia bacterium]|nr:SUMF1/EgtB/PvdO family nonheme iron enzyme [Verrucomicrobiota bacterium]
MLVRSRPNPAIPDHEVLRKIGGGAYGEVWLACGVTGALRAVKVVWREDFEDERGFEREFEGILKYEPISRDHPGLVNILHVGRSPDGVSFYYYVMELGDDLRTGRDINPIEYEPRTLRADHHQATGVPWDTGDCIDVGLRLAEALHHLHAGGLAHRDVKPSNVIFVNGKAKLADIGLVAAHGQRTFVGTEGFVPPEGPGSTQADVYSLGKVLYEIATGKDRMNFPELPDEMPAGAKRKRWLELNRIICDVCEPRISKRTITTAGALAEALRRIQRGKSRRRSNAAVWLTIAVLTGIVGLAGWEGIKDMSWVKNWSAVMGKPGPTVGMLRVFSTPEGADVLDANGVLVGTTPTPTMTARVGEEVCFTLRKNGYRPLKIRGMMTLVALSEPLAFSGQLEVFCPPNPGDAWVDHLGSSYQAVDDHHVGTGYVTQEVWSQFAKATKLAKQAAETLRIASNEQDVVLATADDTNAFCGWLRNGGILAGFLTENHEVLAQRDLTLENPGLSKRARRDDLRPFRVIIRQIVYGRILLTSSPPGAEVYMNHLLVGTTDAPLLVKQVKPGVIDLRLVLEGYKPRQLKITVIEGQTAEASVTLEKSQGVVFGQAWENGIHMRFAPVGQDLMVSIWETRVSDYALFVKESGHVAPRPAYFAQGPDHPVVNVSRDDAVAFCDWLTTRERKAERISQSHAYRLPTDLEWSLMAGLEEEEGISPGWRDAHKQKVYPWGADWPDGEKVGNFADMSADSIPGVPSDRTIAGYDDGFPYTAPVGSFQPNNLGLFDLSGNVQEWVADEYLKFGTNALGVLRGGGWNTYQTENLYTGSRNAVPPTYQDSIYGFRVVLAKVPPKSE